MAKSKGLKLMQGNEAVAEAAIIAGLKFFAGYPITPSTEIAEILAKKLPQISGKFIQMEDEIASIAAIIGASITGLKSMTATSGPGFSLMQENLGYAAITETPIVITNVQRVGPSTGWPTGPAQGDIMQSRWGTHGDHPVAVLTPGSVKQCFTQTILAFNIAEKFRVPVILLTDEVVGHMRENVNLPKSSELTIVNRRKPTTSTKAYIPFNTRTNIIPPMASFGEGLRFHVTGLTHDEYGKPDGKPEVIDSLLRRLEKKMDYILDYVTPFEEYNLEDADVVIVAYGCVARSAVQAMNMAREKGMKVGVLQPLLIWPFHEKRAITVLGDKKIIVAEMNLGQYYQVIKGVVNKENIYSHTRVDGEIITPEELLQKVLEVN